MWETTIFGYDLYYLFYSFVIYSVLGWVYESVYVSIKTRTVVNRGFLNGPMIPIYGFGAVICGLILRPLQGQILHIFMAGMTLATVLEYITSYLMEKIFHAKWWDYTKYHYNLEGRICLHASLFWGVLSVLLIQVMQPLSDEAILKIPDELGERLAYVIAAGIFVDVIITIKSTVQLEQKLAVIQRLREEFTDYLMTTKLYETKEDIVGKYEESKLSDMIERFTSAFEERYDKVMEKRGSAETVPVEMQKQTIKNRVNVFVNQYQKMTGYKNYIQKRILKAFPNFKVMNREGALLDIKEKLHIKKR